MTDREALAALLMREGIAVENVASMGNADQWLPDYDLADRLLAAGVHLGDEGLAAAWKRAEAALPDHLDERSLSFWWDNRKPASWWAAASHRFDPTRPIPLIVKGYATKEAALDALVAALATSAEGEDPA